MYLGNHPVFKNYKFLNPPSKGEFYSASTIALSVAEGLIAA
jgi:hypothetical protein